MLKTIVFVLIAIALSAFAAMQFLAQLEKVSASRAGREEDVSRRSLEFGLIDKVILTAIFAAVMIVLSLLSKFWLISTIIALVISVFMVLVNTYLKTNGFNVLPTLFLLWVGNLIASIKDAGFTTSSTGWGRIYVVLQVIALVLLLIGTVAGNVLKFYRTMKDENESEEELEAEIEVSKVNDDTKETEEDGDKEGDDEDADDWKDLFKRILSSKAFSVVAFILIIVLALALGYWLDLKTDFFWPYRS